MDYGLGFGVLIMGSSILGSILGFPYFGRLLFRVQGCPNAG